MKAIILICLVCFISSFLHGCSDNMVIDGKVYETYGILNKEDNKEEGIKYKVCWGNVTWGAILFETVIAPIYFFGFDMWEPVSKTPIK